MMLTAERSFSLLGSILFGLFIIGFPVSNAITVKRAIAMHELKSNERTAEQNSAIQASSSVADIGDICHTNCTTAIRQAKEDGYESVPDEPFGGLRFNYVRIHKDFDNPASYDTQLVVVCSKSPAMIVILGDTAYITF